MKIGFLFPGYGSQYVGMGKELYDSSRIVQEFFEEASSCLDQNYVKLCFASSDAELGKMSNAYPSLFLVSAAIVALLKEKGIQPDIVAGYNLGEYNALFAADGVSLPDGLYMLNKFALFYQEALEKFDAATARVKGVSRDELKNICSTVSVNVRPVSIAIYNNQKDHIISGFIQAVEEVNNHIHEWQGAKFKELSPEVGMHSALIDNVVEQFEVYLAKVDFHDLSIPLINSNGQRVTEGKDVEKDIIGQLNNPIHWDTVLDQFEDCDLIVEVGPGTVLNKLAKQRYPEKQILSVEKQADIDTLMEVVGIENKQEDDENQSEL